MSSTELQRFIKQIEVDHMLATGLKSTSCQLGIVQFAVNHGFDITLSEWIRFCLMDQLQLSDRDIEMIWTTKTDHWSWAFRQIGAWRSLLMDGANEDSFVDLTNSPSTTAPTDDKDQLLDNFIALARQDQTLQQQIREARNNSEILEIANARGYTIDSMTLLKKWSQHTDFSKPTWLGWFD